MNNKYKKQLYEILIILYSIKKIIEITDENEVININAREKVKVLTLNYYGRKLLVA